MRSRPDTQAGQAFLLALLVSAAIFLPFVVIDKGYFIFYGDFNVQQIPFYKLAHEAVRSGDVFWSWYTDLGANFIGSYSFYLLFSPFFWLTLPFPTSALPFLMAPLLVLKTACASLTAYMYLERFTEDKDYAVLGSILYAFSGWMSYNIFFNHFHEAAVFFPLMLLGVEKLVYEDKKCFFALTVAVNAMVNYWFFVGEAVFILLYVFIRMTDKTFRMDKIKFLRLSLEAVLGVGLASVVLVPSVMALMGNPRTGAEELATGWNAWIYWNGQRLPAILQSLLFPPELPARPNFFPDHGAKWSSLSAWLPMLGLTGTLAYFFAKKNDWLKKILAVCLLFALVPVFNSLFILLNNSYYARWFYMPILLMSLATVKAIEESARGAFYFKRSLKWVIIITSVFLIMCGVTPLLEDGELTFGLAKDIPLMWAYGAITFIGLMITAVLVVHHRYKKWFLRAMTASVAIFSAAFAIFFIGTGKSIFERSDFVINTAINGKKQIDLPMEPFSRSDAFEAQDNLLMFWRLPNIQAFHSIVPASIMEFYPAVGVTRDVGSRPEAGFTAIRPLLSVRFLFIERDKEEQSPMPGYSKYAEMAGFNVYENDNYLPMGFCYDKYVTRTELEDIFTDNRSNMMLRAVVLDEETIERNNDILEHMPINGEESFNAKAMARDVSDRRKFTATDFSFDNRGFSAATDFSEPKLVFFSVPYEAGWSAEVNGEPAQIEKANIGFMAVRVPQGKCEIRFNYFTPGLKNGFFMSLACLMILLCYYAFVRIRGKNEGVEHDARTLLLNGVEVCMPLEEYISFTGNAQEAPGSADMPERLDDEERTFHFEIED